MKSFYRLLAVLAAASLCADVCTGQTVLGKHPADKVLLGFLSQNTNANTLVIGLNTYSTLPWAPPGGITLGRVTRLTWPTGGAWDAPETILTNWQPQVTFTHSLNIVGGQDPLGGIALPSIFWVWANGNGTTNSFWMGLTGSNDMSFSGVLHGDAAGLYNLTLPPGVVTNWQWNVDFLHSVNVVGGVDPLGGISLPGINWLYANGDGTTNSTWMGMTGPNALSFSGVLTGDGSGLYIGPDSLDAWTSAKARSVTSPLYDPIDAAFLATNGWPWLALTPVLPPGVVTNWQPRPTFVNSMNIMGGQDPLGGIELPSLYWGWSNGDGTTNSFWMGLTGPGVLAFSGVLSGDASGLHDLPIDAGENITLTANGSRLVINSSGGAGLANEFTTTPALNTNTFARLQSANGQVAQTNLGTGTPDASRYLRGDGGWTIPPGAVTTTTNIPKALIYSADGYGSNFCLDFNYQAQALIATNDMVFLFSTNGPDAAHSGEIWALITPTNYTRKLYFTGAATNWVVDGIYPPYVNLPPLSAAVLQAHALGVGETNVSVSLRIFQPAPAMGDLPTFNPRSVGGLIFWVVAGSGCYTNEYGTNGVVGTGGDAVRYWADQSGAGYFPNATNATSCLTYQPNGGPNGYPAVANIGTAGPALKTRTNNAYGAPLWIFAVAKNTSSAVGLVDGIDDTSHRFSSAMGASMSMVGPASTSLTGYNGPLNTFSAWSYFWNITQSYMRTNGVMCGTVGNTASPIVSGFIFPGYGGTVSGNTWVSELAVYAGNLTSNQVQAIDEYLRRKYALY